MGFVAFVNAKTDYMQPSWNSKGAFFMPRIPLKNLKRDAPSEAIAALTISN